MAVRRETTTARFRGLSTDQKPGAFTEADGLPVQKMPIGSVFTESDTGRRYAWDGNEWIRLEQTIEALLETLIASNTDILAMLKATHRGHEEHLWEETVPIEE